jgi:putative membrane protein
MKKAAGKRIVPTIYLLGFAGALLFTILLIREGAHEVVRAVAAAGWWLAVIPSFHVLPLFLDSFEWWLLFPAESRPRLRNIFWARFLGESFSNLVPAAQVGGDIVRARVAVLYGTPMAVSVGTVLVDITVSMFIQTLFTMVGVSLLIWVTGRTNLLGPALMGAPFAILAVAGFYFVQRWGMFRLFGAIIAHCAKDESWRSLVVKSGELDQMLRKIYSRTGPLAACCAVTMISFVTGSVEVWIGLYALGIPASFEKALILECVGQGIQTMLCLIPGALGVREGGYIVVGGLLGIPGDAAFALALLRRVRESALGLPGLLAWQLMEGRHFLRRYGIRWLRRNDEPGRSALPD